MGRRYHERVQVENISDIAPDIRRITFDKSIRAEPGQFVKLWIPRVGERPFSVLNDSPLELGIKKLGGAFTEKVFRMYPGQRMFIRGPYGRSFTPYVSKAGRKILICGGCGIVPLEFLASRLRQYTVIALVGAKSKDELPGLLRTVKPITATDDGTEGHKGLVTDLIDKMTKVEREAQFFICGPEQMMAAAAEKAERMVPPENIVLSLERYMKCGRGLCGSCELDGWRICVDGPVFSYDQIRGGDFGIRKRLRSGRRVPL